MTGRMDFEEVPRFATPKACFAFDMRPIWSNEYAGVMFCYSKRLAEAR